jgi:D-glycero-alpha-D-manno-heptose 1-phosphate guanylyltransferase
MNEMSNLSLSGDLPEAIVLAGGFGTRLRSVVSDVPKPMAPVQGKPFLHWVLTSLTQKGVRRVVLSVGYKHQHITAFFGERYGDLDVAYAIEATPLGTGGAIAASFEQVKGDHALVLNGDTFLDLELAALAELWQAHRQPIIVGRQVADAGRYGRMEVSGDGQLQGFAEKGAAGAGLINAGAYVLSKAHVDRFFRHTAPFSLETQVLPPLLAVEPVWVFETNGMFIDIGVPEDFLRVQGLDLDTAGRR